MVEKSARKDIPQILLVSNPGSDCASLLLDRLAEMGQIDRHTLVWKFDTKYYTADV